MLNDDCLLYISKYITEYTTFIHFINLFNLDINNYFVGQRLHKLKNFTETFKNDIFYLAKFLQSINSSIFQNTNNNNFKKYNIIYIDSLSTLRYIIKKNTHYLASHCVIDRHGMYHMYIYKFKNFDKNIDYYDIYIYSIQK